MSFVSAYRVQAARRLLAQLVVVAAVVLGIGDGAADVPAGDLTKFESIVFLSDSTHAYLFDKKTDASIEVVDVATGRRLGDPLGQNAMPPALKLGTAALAEKRIDFRGGPLSAIDGSSA